MDLSVNAERMRVGGTLAGSSYRFSHKVLWGRRETGPGRNGNKKGNWTLIAHKKYDYLLKLLCLGCDMDIKSFHRATVWPLSVDSILLYQCISSPNK